MSKQEYLEQLKAEASPDTVIIPNYHKTSVKTENLLILLQT